jgi:hypothetical protein
MKSDQHNNMVKALQQIVVPRLRERGFRGSFPHFRRISDDKIDLLTFQFDNWGGGFVLEISKCPPNGIMTTWGEHIPPNKVKAWNVHPSQRTRLQPKKSSSTADWFRYDNSTLLADTFEKTARDVLPFLDIAEKWWKDFEMKP